MPCYSTRQELGICPRNKKLIINPKTEEMVFQLLPWIAGRQREYILKLSLNVWRKPNKKWVPPREPIEPAITGQL